MVKRILEKELLEFLTFFPAVGIIGPRQSGKTTLARILMERNSKKSVYLDLESPTDRNKLTEPEYFFEDNKDNCVVLDEIQRLPQLFPLLRSVIDKHRIPGRFIILGSANPGIIKDSSESLAGRIAYKELYPFNISEIGFENLKKHWLHGGFPDAYKQQNIDRTKIWLENFVTTYIERDLPVIGLDASSVTLANLWTMLAHNHGNIFNASNFARSLGVSSPTITRYLHFLDEAFLINRLMPFYYNTKKRLVKSPKVYIRDSGVLHCLTNTLDPSLLPVHIIVGASWEGYVVEQVKQLVGRKLEMYYYRTHHGTECDIVLVKGLKPVASIEIKYSSTPNLTKSFTLAINDLGTKVNFIITPDCEDYYIRENVKVCSLQTFLTVHLKDITSQL
ncbi:MAG: ATP-binding protein [Bacteroidales bacterium]|jgi:predicted AAA+ superfamily ATPase